MLRDLDHILNAHNQVFEDGIDKGLLGIASYLALMIYLLWHFAKTYRQSNRQSVEMQTNPLGLAGILLIVGFATFGLTNITFTHGTFNTFFVCMVMLLMTGVRAESILPHSSPSRH